MEPNKIFLRVLLLLIFFMTHHPRVSAGAEFYRWKDKDGVTHVSNQPPDKAVSPGNDLKVLRIPERPDAPPAKVNEQVVGLAGQHVILFERHNGAMLVDVIINDRVNAKMLLDTGASMTSINVDLLRKLNQSLPARPVTGKAITAGGMVDVSGIIIEKIDLGGAVKRNVWATYSDEKFDLANCDGLLGMSFLADFKFIIDYGNNTITLHK